MKMKLRYELFKLCKSKVLLITAVLFLSLYFVLCAVIRPDLSEYPFDTSLYKMFCEKYSGEFSQQTLDEMNAELEQLTQQSQQPFENKAFTAEEYLRADNKRIAAQQKANALGAVIKRYQQLKSGAHLVYDLELNVYHIGWLRRLGLLLCLAMITVITLKIALDDHKCGMEQILFTTAEGKRKLLCAKAFAVALLAFGTAVLFGCAEMLVLSRWELGDLNAPLCSFKSFENISAEISMHTALRLTSALHIIFFTVYSLVLTVLARVSKSDIAAAALSVWLMGFCVYQS